MRVLSSAEMQACDRATVEQFGIPSFDLMRAASAAVAEFARGHFPNARKITVLCGRGNNGGDGMMAARLLAEAGRKVTTLLLGDPDKLAGDAAEAWKLLTSAPRRRVGVIRSAEELERHGQAFQADLIVDALVGTGFEPPLRALPLAAVEKVRACGAQVLAVDLPSGWPADETNAIFDGPVSPADAVVTFTAPKPAHVFGHLTRSWDQPVVVAPIGSPDEAIASSLDVHWAGAALALARRPRVADSNKGNFGHVLVVGGSFGSAGGKAGAPALVGMGALRAGAGLVTVAVPEPALVPAASLAPELMTWPLAATAEGCIRPRQLHPDLLQGKTVLAIGPGMGHAPETAEFLLSLLSQTDMPAVLDADALNILARQPDLLRQIAKNRTVVLTPHPGEMARLAGVSTAEVQANRLECARSFARRHGVIVVLKGARTLIAHPGGRVAVNTSGNPGMAKGGSGDLLTGMVAGLLAQHAQESALAVEAAVFLHGHAADLAVRHADEHTLLATDSLRWLARAFQYPAFHFGKHAAGGYVWLQGDYAGDRTSFASAEEMRPSLTRNEQ